MEMEVEVEIEDQQYMLDVNKPKNNPNWFSH